MMAMTVGAGSVDRAGGVIAAAVMRVVDRNGVEGVFRRRRDRAGFRAAGRGVGDGDQDKNGEERGDKRQQASNVRPAPIHASL